MQAGRDQPKPVLQVEQRISGSWQTAPGRQNQSLGDQ